MKAGKAFSPLPATASHQALVERDGDSQFVAFYVDTQLCASNHLSGSVKRHPGLPTHRCGWMRRNVAVMYSVAIEQHLSGKPQR